MVKNKWCPEVCPITGLKFFMWIQHHATHQEVPTYGGPFDSYTIPVKRPDGAYVRERFDHDLGYWRTDEFEDIGIQIVDDQLYVSESDPQETHEKYSKAITGRNKLLSVLKELLIELEKPFDCVDVAEEAERIIQEIESAGI